ncbi:hypothetical protein CYLTODRAFT_488865 [Cylindrobasidium torrendii FP15055 ss-10]|uniref:Uncharacterized protein n=1 Tax=Cylindrobasidium torrendii FP15055 ss-10 TaxID=1314674 RepID=A0A0D7BG02_9AGAR|nr:hypothetical protein CYLTODRAFT_488865 [Cylindrobasidium torrendii FP15055 ss-10]
MAKDATVSASDKAEMYATLTKAALSRWTANKLRVLDFKDVNTLIKTRLGEEELRILQTLKSSMGWTKDQYIDHVILRIKKSVSKASKSSSSSPKRKGVSASASILTNSRVASTSAIPAGNPNDKGVSGQGESVDGRRTSQGVYKVTKRPEIVLPLRLLEDMQDQYPHLFPKGWKGEEQACSQPVAGPSSFWSGETKKPRPSTRSTSGETLQATDPTQPVHTVGESSTNDVNMDILTDDSGDDSSATMIVDEVDDKHERMMDY